MDNRHVSRRDFLAGTLAAGMGIMVGKAAQRLAADTGKPSPVQKADDMDQERLVLVGMARGPLKAEGVESRTPVHDPLEGVATWFDSGHTKVALIALDMAGLSYERGKVIREEIGKRCELPADSVVLHSTHTHTGSGGRETEGLGERLAALVARARGNAQAAQIAYAQADTEGRFNVNRRKTLPCGLGVFTTFLGLEDSNGKPDGGRQNRLRLQKWLGQPVTEPELQGPMIYDAPVDSLLQGVFLRSTDGKPIGSIIRFACHPTPAGHTTERMQSADFPTVVRARLRDAFGGECAYLTGPSGNIEPWERGDWVYNDPTPQEDPEVFDPGVFWWIRQRDPKASWKEMERIGNGLADEIVPLIPAAEAFRACESVAFAMDRPALPLRTDMPGSVEEVKRQRAEACKQFFQMRGRASLAEMKAQSDRVCRLHFSSNRPGRGGSSADKGTEQTATVDLPTLRLNDIVLMGFPGETFWQTPQKARRAAEGRQLRYISFTLANGGVGYIPTEADRPLGDYEVDSCRLADGAEAKLEAAAEKLIAKV